MSVTYLGLHAPAKRMATRNGRERRYSEVHKLQGTLTDEPMLSVRDHEELPDYFQEFSEDSGCLVLSKDAEQQTNPLLWFVTIEYSSDCPNPNEEGTTPLARVFRPEVFYEKYKRPTSREAGGDILRNAAGDPIIRELDDSRMVVQWQKNLADYDIDFWTEAKDALNDDTWLGMPRGEWKVDDIRAIPRFESNTAYYEVHFRFHHNPATWVGRSLNQGFTYLDVDDFRYRFRDKQGGLEAEPRLLDREGFPLGRCATTLAADATAGAANITLASGAAALALRAAVGTKSATSSPFDDYGFIEIGDEVLQITGAPAGAVLPVARATRGSAAAAHSSGAAVTGAPIEILSNDYNFIDYTIFGLS